MTAGGTREHLDPVRFLGNRSSGRQGHALARAAVARGAEVVLVAAAGLPDVAGATVVRVTSAEQLRAAILAHTAAADAVVMAAAVADYRPAERLAVKRKKTATMTVELVQTPDVLAELVGARPARGRSWWASRPRPATPTATCSRTAGPSSPARAATCWW